MVPCLIGLQDHPKTINPSKQNNNTFENPLYNICLHRDPTTLNPKPKPEGPPCKLPLPPPNKNKQTKSQTQKSGRHSKA